MGGVLLHILKELSYYYYYYYYYLLFDIVGHEVASRIIRAIDLIQGDGFVANGIHELGPLANPTPRALLAGTHSIIHAFQDTHDQFMEIWLQSCFLVITTSSLMMLAQVTCY